MYKKIKVIPKNNPNKKLKPQFAQPVLIISTNEGDENFYDHPSFNVDDYSYYAYEKHIKLCRSIGKKRRTPGVKQNICQRLGHVVDYPEHHFSRNKPFKHVWDVIDANSGAYKLAENWKGNSKRRKQWYK